MTIAISLLTITTYLISSIPFSLIIGKIFLGKDIRDYGDGNPGATNVKRAGGSLWLYLIALFADAFKGLFPVGIPYHLMGWSAWDVIPVAFAAMLGHAFSIFLGFKGGKAIAVSAGIWVGLLVFEAVALIPIALVFWFLVVAEDEWAITLTLLTLLVYLLFTRADNTALLLIWLSNMALILYTHRNGQLRKLPTLRYFKTEST
ncbi:MAG: glycerol-3-phosphate 1-O-acyltransferase PlsY [Phototrophicaceae bacterium]